jgi:hypothetical protein
MSSATSSPEVKGTTMRPLAMAGLAEETRPPASGTPLKVQASLPSLAFRA